MQLKQKARGDVSVNQTGEAVRTYTFQHNDPVADRVNEFAVQELNRENRYQEADELAKVPGRRPPTSSTDGSELPGDMEPSS